ncbi:MAG TPA: flagellar basal-body protein FlbY [Brevundimonas sp.]|jgi:phospho-2-dehydro-3-deoxyheptonate aldolase
MSDQKTATDNARRLKALTERLTERLVVESRAFAERRPRDVLDGMIETQELANQYRRESAQVKANPSLLSACQASERMALVKATERFNQVLAGHARAVEAARIISEGLVQTIAGEVAASRAMGTGYGASGRAAPGDGRAITLNRSA